MFVTDEKISEVAEDLMPIFRHGDLHSQTRLGKVAIHAKEALQDHGLPTRSSLCFVVAKIAMIFWREEISKVNQHLREIERIKQ